MNKHAVVLATVLALSVSACGGGDGKQVYKRQGSRLTLQVIFDGDAAMHTVKVKHVYELKTP